MTDFPWCDCKVAFPVDDPDAFDRWMDRTRCGEGILPAGWSLTEVDCAGARCVAVFRVETALSEADGKAVARIVRQAGRLRRRSNG